MALHMRNAAVDLIGFPVYPTRDSITFTRMKEA